MLGEGDVVFGFVHNIIFESKDVSITREELIVFSTSQISDFQQACRTVFNPKLTTSHTLQKASGQSARLRGSPRKQLRIVMRKVATRNRIKLQLTGRLRAITRMVARWTGNLVTFQIDGLTPVL
jgi:hypothetical protein